MATNTDVEQTFSITCTGEEKTSALVERGRYDWTDRLVRNDLFPIKPHESEERKIVLISFEYSLTSEEVLAEFERRGLERPTLEDALVFGVTYPDEQRKYYIAFLHEPVQVDGSRNVLVLGEYTGERYLGLGWFGVRWGRSGVFAAVRK